MVSQPHSLPPHPHKVSEVIFEPDYGNLPGVPLVEVLHGMGLKSCLFKGDPPNPGKIQFELFVSFSSVSVPRPQVLMDFGPVAGR